MARRALVIVLLVTSVSFLRADTRAPVSGRAVVVGEWRLFLEPKKGVARRQRPPYERVDLYANWVGLLRGAAGAGQVNYSLEEALLSVVGPIVSVQHESWSSGGHYRTNHSRRIYAHNLSVHAARLRAGEEEVPPSFDGGDVASLTDLFDSALALAAVAKAGPVKAALGSRAPRSWEELREYLYCPDLPFELSAEWESLTTSFAIMDVSGATARVRFSLDPCCRACDYRPEFEVDIPIPSHRRQWFDQAKRDHLLGCDLASH